MKSYKDSPIRTTVRLCSSLTGEQLGALSSWMAPSISWLHYGYTGEECRKKLLHSRFLSQVVSDRDREFELLAAAERKFVRCQPGKSVHLMASELNARAWEFYRGLGFGEIESIPDYKFYEGAKRIMGYPEEPKRSGTSLGVGQ
jgi:hypothetical protein